MFAAAKTFVVTTAVVTTAAATTAAATTAAATTAVATTAAATTAVETTAVARSTRVVRMTGRRYQRLVDLMHSSHRDPDYPSHTILIDTPGKFDYTSEY